MQWGRAPGIQRSLGSLVEGEGTRVWAAGRRPAGGGGSGSPGVRARAPGLPKVAAAGLPHHMSAPGQGGGGTPPHCLAGAPPAPPYSPDSLQLIAWVFYFFLVNLTEGQKQVLSHQEPAPASAHSEVLPLPPPQVPEDLEAAGAWPRVWEVFPPPTSKHPPTLGPRACDLPRGPNGAASPLQHICNSWLRLRLH